MDNPVARLAQVILQSATNLTKECEAQGIKIPSLDDTQATDQTLFSGKTAVDAGTLVEAAFELINIITPAELRVFTFAQGSLRAASIRAAIQLHVAEILREGNQKGVHIDDIARLSNVDAAKLSRVLRLLSSYKIFREIEPNVFVNNRLSSVLDSGQPVSVLVSSPEMKFGHEESQAIAWLEHLTDDFSKPNVYLAERLKTPNSPALPEPLRSLDGKAEYPDWRAIELTDEYKTRSFLRRALGSGLNTYFGFDTFFDAPILKELNGDAKIVGIGIESGQLICDLAKKYTNLTYVVYDSETIDQLSTPTTALEIWNADANQVKTGRIKLQLGDVAALQNAAAFIITFNLYWSDEYFLKQLTDLRHAANKDTSLIVGVYVPSTSSSTLLDGVGSTFDLAVTMSSNGKLRASDSVNELLGKTGWKVTDVPTRIPYAAVRAIPV